MRMRDGSTTDKSKSECGSEKIREMWRCGDAVEATVSNERRSRERTARRAQHKVQLVLQVWNRVRGIVRRKLNSPESKTPPAEFERVQSAKRAATAAPEGLQARIKSPL